MTTASIATVDPAPVPALIPVLLPVRETLLVLSDVHLGSDLDDFARAAGADARDSAFRRRSARIDADLVALLHHYRQVATSAVAEAASEASGAASWRLVVAGDFVDFLGMVIRTDGLGVETTPSAEESEHGLGNAEDHARIKLERVIDRHADVFAELAAFIADGHSVTFVHGNHDLEFHWPAVQATLKAALVARSAVTGANESDGRDRAAFEARIDFAPWFFYRGGVAYIEHGHQYDRFCATDHVMAPLSPLDPRRLARGFCDVLLRFVVRPTRGMSEHGHETKGMVDYLRFAAKLGLTGMARLGIRFTRAIIELFRLRRGHLSETGKALRAEHERRMTTLATVMRVGIERLRALAALQSPPITRSVRGILASLLLDRLALLLTAAFVLTAATVLISFFASHASHQAVGMTLATGLVVSGWYVAHRYLANQRQLDPREQMIDRAGKLAKLFPAAFVVMGHTHVPERIPVTAVDHLTRGSSQAQGTTYINVGSWSEEEEEGALAFRAARTHLVIRPLAEGAEAEFLTWDPDVGPKRFEKS